ncbi:hypothetical protein G9A89_013707 [Geosiphon pyriformis]|nr:hypothetical protein G9A89_013707 [Geosiphon pyriformis]
MTKKNRRKGLLMVLSPKISLSGAGLRQFENMVTDSEEEMRALLVVDNGYGAGHIVAPPFGTIDFNMDKDEVCLPPPHPIALASKWLNPMIVKEVLVRKSFALDIDLSAVKGKNATAKVLVIRKLFSTVIGFGEATTPVCGLPSLFSDGVVHLLGVSVAFDVLFGSRKLCLFFSGLGVDVTVRIDMRFASSLEHLAVVLY